MSETRSSTDRSRRTHVLTRQNLRWPVRVSAIEPEIDPVTALPCYWSFEESSVNVSEGGVFITGDDTLTPGRRVLVELDLPSGDSIQAVGEVAWRRHPHAARSGDRPAGMGIEFTGIARSSALALARALEPRRRGRPTTNRPSDRALHR